MNETVMIARPDGEMPVYRWHPQTPRGGVIIVQEIFGVSPYIRQRAEDLAQAGYVVDVPELFFRHEEPLIADDDPELLQKGMALASDTPWDQAVADLLAAVQGLTASLSSLNSPQKLGLVGFCYGGGLAYAATATAEIAGESPIDALVSYYGSALPDLLNLVVEAPSLHHFGTADQFIPMPKVEKIREHVTKRQAQFELYDGADHAFDNTLPAFHYAEASAQAWPRTLAFLSDHV